MFDLTGKTALVTGASGGLGRDMCAFLHRQGVTLVVTGTNEAALQALAQELGERVAVMPCQLSDPDAVETLAQEAQAHMGSIDILVNNAGIVRDNLLLRMKDEEWDDVIRLNLSAAFRLTRGVLRGMLKRRFGRIINISSVVGTIGHAGQANYAAAKAGLVGFTKSLAEEVAPRGITANCIAPGFIATPMTHRLTDEQKAKICSAIPMGRMGYGADVAAAVVYLASDEAGFVTGHVLHVNGGMAMV